MGSAYVQESRGSERGDDDKVYFFFSERAVEYDCDQQQVVARVARVCKVSLSSWTGQDLCALLSDPLPTLNLLRIEEKAAGLESGLEAQAAVQQGVRSKARSSA